MIRKITITLALILAVATLPLSAQVKFHTGAVDELYSNLDNEKLIFMDLYASWCPPCKMMERDVFSREDVGKFMSENFLSAKYNVDEAIGKELSRTYSVSSIPTYLIFNPEGELVGRMSGSMPAEKFISAMQEILDKVAEKK